MYLAKIKKGIDKYCIDKYNIQNKILPNIYIYIYIYIITYCIYVIKCYIIKKVK